MKHNLSKTEKHMKNAEWKSRLTVIGLVLVIAAIMLLLGFLLQGETRVTGEWDDPETVETVTCKSDEAVYPFFKYDNADNRSLKVISTFTNDALENISLTYQLKYSDPALAERSDAENQAAMNFSFDDNGFGPYAFDAKFSNTNGIFQMTLYSDSEKLQNSGALKYFMLDDLSNARSYTRDLILKNYTDKGVNCVYKELTNKETNEN